MMTTARKLSIFFGVFLAGIAQAGSPKVVARCETLSQELDSTFAIYDHDLTRFKLEWTSSDHHVTGHSPLFSEVVRKNTIVQMDTGGSLISEDPDRVKIEVDLRSGKGRMKYYKWYGYQSSLFSGSAKLKLEAEVVCSLK